MQPLRRTNQRVDSVHSAQSIVPDALNPKAAEVSTVGTKAVVCFGKGRSQQSMTNVRTMPASRRLIRNGAGLFFKGGEWTAYASEATVFSNIAEALHARERFGLEDIKLVVPCQECPRPSN